MTDIKHICAELAGLAKRAHYSCEDSWYNCPKAEGGCANDAEGDECNCGADAHNAKISELLATGLAEPEPEGDDYKVASDKTMRRIRSTTKRWILSLIITTNDSAIDSRLGPGIWKVLDTENEILETISLPKLLSSKDAQ